MQNISLLPRITLLALALATAGATGAFAQTTATTPASTTAAPVVKGNHNLAASLTPAEAAQFEKDRTAVLAANPDLKAEADALKEQHKAIKGQGPDAKAAFKTQVKAHEQKMEIALLKIDPSIAPILSKIKAAKKAAHQDKSATPAA